MYSYQELEQSVCLDLQELQVKNPTMATIDDMVGRIMDGTPGSELDRSLLEIDGSDSVVHELAGGKSLMEMPERLAQDDFSIKDFTTNSHEEDEENGQPEEEENQPAEDLKDGLPLVDKNGK